MVIWTPLYLEPKIVVFPVTSILSDFLKITELYFVHVFLCKDGSYNIHILYILELKPEVTLLFPRMLTLGTLLAYC